MLLLYILLFILLFSNKYEEIILTYIFIILYLTYTYYIPELSFIFWFLIIIYSSALAIIFIITIMLFNIKLSLKSRLIYDLIPSKLNINSNKLIYLLLLFVIFILLYNNYIHVIPVITNIITIDLNLNNYLIKIINNLYYNYFVSSILILKLLLFYLYIILKILK